MAIVLPRIQAKSVIVSTDWQRVASGHNYEEGRQEDPATRARVSKKVSVAEAAVYSGGTPGRCRPSNPE
ncbi:protein of unknown function [Bradyrhizobium vignae]|uniref:Uncharacterized protein n=1 Tax=Bradyrhizobium vignae TaxID=1549949 RepID=A0A2U3PUG1_9BRAD|nr:protein of unknown function [Bradyrhizobium vignae]